MCQSNAGASSSMWRFVPVNLHNHDGQGTNLALLRAGARASSFHPPSSPHNSNKHPSPFQGCSLGELSAGSVARCAQLFCQQISWDALQLHTPPSPSKAACEMLLLFEQRLAPIALTSSNYCSDKIKVLSCFANIFEAPIQQQR